MYIINDIILGTILTLFPLTIYAIYISYLNTFYKKEKNIYLDFALFSSLFFIIKYLNTNIVLIFIINIPLLIAYLKARHKSIIIMSIVISICIGKILVLSALYFAIEYLIYYILYRIINNKYKFMNIFICVKGFIISVETILLFNYYKDTINFLYLVLLMITFIIITYFILNIIRKADSFIEFKNIKMELDKEKELKLALFKLTHEVKNPIAVCKGYLEMMNFNDLCRMKKYYSIISNELNRTLVIINDFSDYGKLKIEKEIIDLSVLLEEIYDTLNPLFKMKDVDVDFYFDEEIYIDADYNRIKQVLINVLKNSIEAKKDNDKLVLKLKVKVYNKYIDISIMDTGIGMDSDTLSKMSDIFYTTKDNGTGLGVALSHEIIKLHGGSINYKSKLGKGTTVFIKLPVN